LKLSFPTRKLKGSVKKVGKKVAKLNIDAEDYTVYGVSKEDGVTVTGKKIGKNLNTYYFFEGKKFAYNPYRVNIGSIGLSESKFIGLISSAYVIFETDESINDEFLFLYLKSPLGINLINWYGNRGGVRSALRFSDLEKIDFPDLTFEQQTEALNFINKKQEIVDLLNLEFDKQQNLITKLRQSILQEAVQGKLTADWRKANPEVEPASELLKRIKAEKKLLIAEKKIKKENPLPPITDEEKPYDLPESWEWCKMQDLCPNISSGSTPPKPYFREKGIPYLKVYNIRNQNIDFKYKPQYIEEEYHKTKNKRSILRAGDVIMNIVGPPLGKVAIIPNDHKEYNCNQAIAFFKPIERKINRWIYTFLCAGTFLDRIDLIGTAGQDNISVTKSKNIIIPLPPLEEQKAIVSKVNMLMTLCDQLEEQVTQSKQQAEQLMQAVLQEVFTPKQDVLEELILDIDKYAQVAMATLKMENAFGFTHGKVEKQKTGFLLKRVKKQPIPYTFEKSNFGAFSWELSKDLDKNPYLQKVPSGKGEGYEVKASKQAEVLALLNDPENSSYVQAIDELIEVYKMPKITGKTEEIELLNTVCKSMFDTQSKDLNTIYADMEMWTIQQDGFSNKAEKFSLPRTEEMLQLVLKLKWDKQLIF
jgi:type I restriction enzyme S subunit